MVDLPTPPLPDPIAIIGAAPLRAAVIAIRTSLTPGMVPAASRSLVSIALRSSLRIPLPSTIKVATPPSSFFDRIRSASGWLSRRFNSSSMPRRLGRGGSNRQATPVFRDRGFL